MLDALGLELALKGKFREARQGLLVQASHFFKQYSNAMSMVAIAASGPFWSNTTITCRRVEEYAIDWKVNLKWTNIVLVSEHGSDDHL